MQLVEFNSYEPSGQLAKQSVPYKKGVRLVLKHSVQVFELPKHSLHGYWHAVKSLIR